MPLIQENGREEGRYSRYLERKNLPQGGKKGKTFEKLARLKTREYYLAPGENKNPYREKLRHPKKTPILICGVVQGNYSSRVSVGGSQEGEKRGASSKRSTSRQKRVSGSPGGIKTRP